MIHHLTGFPNVSGVRISRDGLERKARKPCNQGEDLQRKAGPRLHLRRGHAHTTTTMLHRLHQFRSTLPVVMIDCSLSRVFRCMQSSTKAFRSRSSRYCSLTSVASLKSPPHIT
jgi:hypothetical protein